MWMTMPVVMKRPVVASEGIFESDSRIARWNVSEALKVADGLVVVVALLVLLAGVIRMYKLSLKQSEVVEAGCCSSAAL